MLWSEDHYHQPYSYSCVHSSWLKGAEPTTNSGVPIEFGTEGLCYPPSGCSECIIMWNRWRGRWEGRILAVCDITEQIKWFVCLQTKQSFMLELLSCDRLKTPKYVLQNHQTMFPLMTVKIRRLKTVNLDIKKKISSWWSKEVTGILINTLFWIHTVWFCPSQTKAGKMVHHSSKMSQWDQSKDER